MEKEPWDLYKLCAKKLAENTTIAAQNLLFLEKKNVHILSKRIIIPTKPMFNFLFIVGAWILSLRGFR